MDKSFKMKLYFWIFNNVKNDMLRFNLMGMISFLKSILKHIKRGNPNWMVKNQIQGFLMCFNQLITEFFKRKTYEK